MSHWAPPGHCALLRAPLLLRPRAPAALRLASSLILAASHLGSARSILTRPLATPLHCTGHDVPPDASSVYVPLHP
eukprot:15457683-Alexandrium_andersonii.AAC.1